MSPIAGHASWRSKRLELTASELEGAIDAAFLAIAHVHRLMSFHDPESEVSRMNRDACYKRVRVHPWTWRVLKSAQEFSRNTNGIFDITMAGQLVKWNYLPAGYGARFGRGSWRDIILEATGHVRFRRPLLIDLGGIAKGFAVDRAVEILKRNARHGRDRECRWRPACFRIGIAARAPSPPQAAEPRCWSGETSRARDSNLGNLFCSHKKPSSLREPNVGRTHWSSRVRLDQRDRGRSELHDGGCTDESCVRTARRSRASTGAVFRRCVVARARRRPLLDVSPNVRHIPPDLIRLRPFHRRLLYGVLALLFFSGAAWAYWNDLVSSPGDFEISAKAWAMKIHGAAAMAILVLVGMLLTGHVRFAWRARRNRGNGSLFLGTFGILTVTGYGLYYAGG